MSISTTVGGVTREQTTISTTVGGVVREFEKLHTVSGGVLYEIFSASGSLPDKLTWTELNGTVKSVSDDGMSITGYITSTQQTNGGSKIAQTNVFILPKGASVTLNAKSASGSGTSATVCDIRMYNGDTQLAYAFVNARSTISTPTNTYLNETGADVECYIVLNGISHTSGQTGATYYNATVEAEVIFSS